MFARGDMEHADGPAYGDFISSALMDHLQSYCTPVQGVDGLVQIGESGGLENQQSLSFLCDLDNAVRADLKCVLEQRTVDRQFIDQRTRACSALNRGLNIPFAHADYHTVIGQHDAQGRMVIGPLNDFFCRAGGGVHVAAIPFFLRGHHVTLFGPPDDAKLSINAMNAFHRKLDGEPAIIERLLKSSSCVAMWGADDEDSKTPTRRTLIRAGENLAACVSGDFTFDDPQTGRTYALADDRLSIAIKRFPGLALPCPFLFHHGHPVPLHLYDFALHFFAHWDRPHALAFYVPKLENEQEAAYVRTMFACAEQLMHRLHPQYVVGTIRALIVLENPRAIFRVNEMIDALHPYFAGASLGWHDYLASTARLMKEDCNYRIPVKADSNIVINHIKASHDLLAQVVGSRGGIKVGGMYGVLPSDNRIQSDSFQFALRGFFKDVVTQLKRDLSGFWIAHPDFVRLGLALVEAWKMRLQGDRAPLEEMVKTLLLPSHHQAMLAFIDGPDVAGLDPSDARYPRALLAADGLHASKVANNDPDEIRYNIFQSLQYLTDWLCGNGCVALPAIIDGVAVRVMDDLATAERSRWEVWHELHHGRFAVEDFVRIAHEEMRFIRKDLSDDRKIVQVKWNDRTRKWYPVAMHLMLHLMSADEPVEFASQLLLPFTLDAIANQHDPLSAAMAIEPGKYALPRRVARCHALFSACGSQKFVREMMENSVMDMRAAQQTLMRFSVDDVNEAASFHGDIGESARGLDATAAREQAGVGHDGDDTHDIHTQLLHEGEKYRAKFDFKFLISAEGKSGSQMLTVLRSRFNNSLDVELQSARDALWQITQRRLLAQPIDRVVEAIGETIGEACAAKSARGLSVCVLDGVTQQTLCFGERDLGQPVTVTTRFQIASLSKSIAACMAMEYFRSAGIALSTCVAPLLTRSGSPFRLRSLDPAHPEWVDQVTLAHLLSHEAINMHFVVGTPANQPLPPLSVRLAGTGAASDGEVGVLNAPGTKFQYSGGGYLILQHLIESLEGKSIDQLSAPFIQALNMLHFSFGQTANATTTTAAPYAIGFLDSGEPLPVGGKIFPAFAAGAIASASDVARFLAALSTAFHDVRGCGPISHDTAVRMLHGVDRGSQQFMGCNMGLGIFTAEAGPNRLCVHQGSNDGFRALFTHCYAGPHAGRGVVILCAGDENAVPCIAQIAQIVLVHLGISGMDWTRVQTPCNIAHVPAAERVNAGYHHRIFRAFERDMPESIRRRGPRDALADFNRAVGASIDEVSNERFARAENLISPHEPLFDPSLFGRQGKIMDSWETVRHNPHECDWLVLTLRMPTQIDCVSVSTQFHLGNQAQSISVDGWCRATDAWHIIVQRSALEGHASHAFESQSKSEYFERVRVRIYPDGGVTRLALFDRDLSSNNRAQLFANHSRAFAHFDAQTHKPLAPTFAPSPQELSRIAAGVDARSIDLASAAFGGRVVSATNQHYGAASQVISPFPPLHMFDGLESARSREPGHSEDVVIQLARQSRIGRIEIDFTHFINNNPSAIAVEGRCQNHWITLVDRTPTKAYAGNTLACQIDAPHACDQIRVTVFPDGGINRVRVFPAVTD